MDAATKDEMLFRIDENVTSLKDVVFGEDGLYRKVIRLESAAARRSRWPAVCSAVCAIAAVIIATIALVGGQTRAVNEPVAIDAARRDYLTKPHSGPF